MTVVRIALAQLDPTVGDLDGNVAKLIDAYDRADAAGCDIVAFPELSITGYPPEDLVLKPGFVADNRAALERFAAHTRDCAAVVGFVDADRDIYNAAAMCVNGGVIGTYRKRLLPNYAVFDEARTFTPGTDNDPLELYEIAGVKVGVSICEDIWSPFGPLATQAAGGAELSVNINGSPYHWEKDAGRERMVATRAQDAHTPIVYVNQVGGQDELVFDGGSFVVDAEGQLLARAPQFVEDLMIVDVPIPAVYRHRLLDPRGKRTDAELPIVHVSDRSRRPDGPLVDAPIADPLDSDEELYQALVLGTRDYCRKNRLHRRRDRAVGRHRLDTRRRDRRRGARPRARARRVDAVALLVRSLEVRRRASSLATSASTTARSRSSPPSRPTSRCWPRRSSGRQPGLTYENLQSRCRGQVLMALSNEFGWMVLTTGNKSEMAVGYFTIYGDSVGGYAVIKDVLKTRVYDICRVRQPCRRPRTDPCRGDHQAAVGRAAPRPARRPVAAALRGARPDPASSTSSTTGRRPRSSRPATTRRSCAVSPGSSTSPSTSATSARPACA